ncbi:MAG: methyl-accepting chemotaxis protein [Gammaproteobacteria bacterium]|nr:methyl-accepting chemotaxis protein [Gammaproteobacteria bacterium]
MNISTKLRYGSLLLALIPATVVGIVVAWTATTMAEDALHREAESRLTVLRESRSRQIEQHFKLMRDQLVVTAQTISTQRALGKLTEAFHDYIDQVQPDIAAERATLAAFYRGPFSKAFGERNGSATVDMSGHVARLSAPAVALQQRYIAANPHPLGSKDDMTALDDDSDYARLHAFFHKTFRELQRRFGYYDIFLVDGASGHVVYSVFKEIDFATSLKSGPFANSGLARAFDAAMAIDRPGQTSITDYAPYFPSYQGPASFLGAPVFYKGEKLGAIVFQVPADPIEAVMTGNRNWRADGLGDSGESYLVGADGTMRSESRFRLEDPKAYLDLLTATGTPAAVVDEIRKRGTVIGIQPVRSPGVERALDGETGFAVFDDYRGVAVLSAYKPLQIDGLRWAILAEIDADEAYAAAAELRSTLVTEVIAVIMIATLVAGGLGFLFANSVARPLRRIVTSMRDISSGEGDLTVRLDASSNDELGDLSRAFNRFVETIDALVGKVRVATESISSSSEELSAVTNETRDGMARQQNEIEHIATAVEQMTGTVREVARSTASTAQAAEHAGGQVATGRQVLASNVESIHALSDRMRESQSLIDALRHDSDRVGTVLEVIRAIAEQTNLLALNAAIEAARAGEQGRGFAVVADEVRVLAQRTQQSTEEIRQIVESLQSRSHESTRALEQNNGELMETVTLTESTQAAFTEIEQAVGELLSMSAQIASATEQQTAATDEIGRNVHVIHDVAQATAAGADQTAASSTSLAQLGGGLQELVGRFKVSG